MECSRYLVNKINDGCPKPFKKYDERGFIASFDDMVKVSEADGLVDVYFTGQVYDLFDRQNKPFNNSKSTLVVGDMGTKTFTENVTFPMISASVLNAEIINMLKFDRVVVILQQLSETGDGQYQIFGYEAGLKLAENVFDNSADAARTVNLISERNAGSAYFVESTVVDMYRDMEVITGLSIASGGAKCGFHIDADKTGYLILPSGAIFTSVNGIIDENNYDAAGECILIIPKNTMTFSIGYLSVVREYTGILITDLSADIDVSSCIGLTGIICPNTISIDASNCAFDRDACSTLVISLDEAGNENGWLDISGGTNAPIETWTVDGNDAVVSLTAKGWTITTNEA